MLTSGPAGDKTFSIRKVPGGHQTSFIFKPLSSRVSPTFLPDMGSPADFPEFSCSSGFGSPADRQQTAASMQAISVGVSTAERMFMGAVQDSGMAAADGSAPAG